MNARGSLARWWWLALRVGVACALSSPGAAGAYCLTTACGEDTARSLCSPPHEGDCGEPLRWRNRCTGFSVQEDGSRRISANATNDLVRAAFETWMKADCGDGEHPGIVIQDMGRAACGALEYNSDRGNANIVVYREERWPHDASSIHNVALTTTTFDPVTGELFDADIEINAANFAITTGDDEVGYDLESILVHEAGHFLGLGHSDTLDATMFSVYTEGDTNLRDLDPDDVAAICDLYPPKRGLDETCNPLPKHGFSPECADLQAEGDCSVRRPGARSTGAALALVAAAVLASAVTRRAARARRRG